MQHNTQTHQIRGYPLDPSELNRSQHDKMRRESAIETVTINSDDEDDKPPDLNSFATKKAASAGSVVGILRYSSLLSHL